MPPGLSGTPRWLDSDRGQIKVSHVQYRHGTIDHDFSGRIAAVSVIAVSTLVSSRMS